MHGENIEVNSNFTPGTEFIFTLEKADINPDVKDLDDNNKSDRIKSKSEIKIESKIKSEEETKWDELL